MVVVTETMRAAQRQENALRACIRFMEEYVPGDAVNEMKMAVHVTEYLDAGKELLHYQIQTGRHGYRGR